MTPKTECQKMQHYIGTKQVRGTPMNRLEYNQLRGWTVPADKNPADAGYLVEYLDGGTPNHPGFAGYISWSPKKQFDDAYRPTDGLPFGLAIEALKKGSRVARAGWNGKGMWLMLVPFDLADKVAFQYAALDSLPWIGMKTADNKFVPWLASQTDMLAEDWVIVE